MATEMEKLGETSDEDEEDMDMDVKEEDDDDDGEESDKGAYSGGMMIAGASADGEFGNSLGNRFQQQQHLQICISDGDQQQNQQAMAMGAGISGSGMRRCRPKEEKERTKLRERHRRAITARILSGLRRQGNYNLRVRADINEVIAALAREAGWTVLSDGTTFPARANSQLLQTGRPPGTPPAPMPSLSPAQNAAPLRGVYGAGARSTDFRSCQIKGVYASSTSEIPGRPRASSMIRAESRGRERDAEDSPHLGNCIDGIDDKQRMDASSRIQERDFAGTPYVPVYVMLPLGVINMKCELVDPDTLAKQLRILKSANVDGVMVDCWWGIVEAHTPQEYNWQGYKRLFQIVRDLKLKLQVVMSFHECGGNVGDDVYIPLPRWVCEIGQSNPDIFFTDRDGRRNTESLTWGIDKERVLRGRTAVEVYFDFMRSFRVEFDEFFGDGVISEIQVGLGPCGELRYPSYPARHGWRYPGIGEFQCYDKYMMKSLMKAAEARGHMFWAKAPDNAGSYNSSPHESGFFRDGGDYDSYYGRFFLGWYSRVLTDHADRVLSLAKLAFEGNHIAAKVSGIHWWYKTASHAAELTAGFYNPCNRDGYAVIAETLKKHDTALNFTCVELRTLDQHEDFPEALADPEGLVWQVLNAAWDAQIPVASENALPCYDREGYNKILENAKPFDDPDGRHLSAFTYLRLSPILMEAHNFVEFERFVKRMHGERVLDFPV